MALPNGYKRLEYIQSNGTQYIDTGFVPNNNTRIELSFLRESSNAAYLYSVLSTNNTKSVTAYLTSTSGKWRFGATSCTFNIPVNTLYTAVVDSSGIVLNGVSHSYDGSVETFTAAQNLIIGADISEAGEIGDLRFVGKIYYFKIYNNGALVRSFIPCKNASGVIGLYDDVSGTFYDNDGSGTYDGGAEIVPDYKIVDANGLDGAIGATADAIREKTGETATIPWDASSGFASAVRAIQSGSGAKVAAGSFTPSSTNAYSNPITVSGIGFKPTRVIIYLACGTGTQISANHLIHAEFGVRNYAAATNLQTSPGTYVSQIEPVCTMQSDGFKITIPVTTFVHALTYNYIAIG